MNTKHTWSTKTVDLLIKEYELGNGMELAHPFWNKDINWRKPYLDFQCTEEEVLEFNKCSNDIVYFANNYCKTYHHIQNIANINLKEFQESAIKQMYENRFTTLKLDRQTGKTLLLTILIVHQLIFSKEKQVLTLSLNNNVALNLMGRIKTIIVGLPFFMKPGIDKKQMNKMCFDNGCSITTRGISKGVGKGHKIHTVVIDDMSYFSKGSLEDVWNVIIQHVLADRDAKCLTVTDEGFNEYCTEPLFKVIK